MTAHGAARLSAGDPLGSSRVATTCLRALADIGRPLPVRELLARLNPRPAQGDGGAWAERHAELSVAVQELTDAGLVHVRAGVVELSGRPEVRSRIAG